LKIDQKVKESRKEFIRGSVAGARIGLTVYSIWSIVKSSAAYAADSPPPGGNSSSNQLLPAKDRGRFGAGVPLILGVGLQSGDFFIGVGWSLLLILAFNFFLNSK
jgi:hypothetical protein